MSATGRGAIRRPDDFYATPGWCTQAILPWLNIVPGMVVLDPCAGSGAILSELVSAPGVNLSAIELDPERGERCSLNGIGCRVGDALDGTPWPGADLVLTNPPYSLAQEFIEHSLERAATTCMLLRLNYLGSQRRAPFWQKSPAAIYVLPRRPSFTGKGTDATEYAWFAWGKGQRPGTWRVLNLEKGAA